jgi:anaerobic ribonucleoside-triphosphate reductase activating protein
MNVDVTFSDYPSKEGLAVICYFSGCEHNCQGCQNIELQTLKDERFIHINDLMKYCERNHTNKIVLSGGDCLYDRNKEITKFICKELGNEYDICIYTGYPIENIDFNGFKFVKCGKYDINNKQDSLKTDNFIQFASSNQKLYNYKKELVSNKGKYEFSK